MPDTHKRIQNPESMYQKKVIVVPKPIVTLPGDYLVKVYDMFYEDESRDTSSWITHLARAVENPFLGNTGLAFLINSDGMMNLSGWEQFISLGDAPSNMILKNRIFTSLKNRRQRFSVLAVRRGQHKTNKRIFNLGLSGHLLDTNPQLRRNPIRNERISSQNK